jgi:hypothetical protein
MPCIQLQVNRCFREMFQLHLQDQRINQGSRPALAPASCPFLYWLILRSWVWRQHVPPEHRLTFSGPRGVISQRRFLHNHLCGTSDPTCYLEVPCTLEVEAGGSSEVLVPLYKTAWCNIPDNCNLNTYCHGNFKPHNALNQKSKLRGIVRKRTILTERPLLCRWS